MHTENRQFFLVTGGAVMAAMERFKAMRDASIDAKKVIADEIGATGFYGNRQECSGVRFPDASKVPKGWRPMRGEKDIWTPNRRSAAGKAMAVRLGALTTPGPKEFTDEVLGRDGLIEFMDYEYRLNWMGAEWLCGKLVLSVPMVPDEKRHAADEVERPYKAKWTPPDEHCRLLKLSEYYALREDDRDERIERLVDKMNTTPLADVPSPVAVGSGTN